MPWYAVPVRRLERHISTATAYVEAESLAAAVAFTGFEALVDWDSETTSFDDALANYAVAGMVEEVDEDDVPMHYRPADKDEGDEDIEGIL